MILDYWTWIGCSLAISAAILLLTIVVMVALLLENDTLFYGVVSNLLNIDRCFLDVHHNIIRKDAPINISKVMLENALRSYGLATTKVLENGTGASPDENASKIPAETKQEISPTSESHPDNEREVLNLYGKYISVHKRGTLPFVMILTTVIISGALIAAFNSLFLATSSVYRDGPCPSVGPMDCFCGGNHTYFSCDTGKTMSCPLDVHSGSCFRWIARDLTTSDVTTQLGVTVGILVGFGKIAQGIIQIYLFAFNKRLGIATGLHRIAAKTIGINKMTARTRCCCCNLPWHCSACNLRLYKHPSAVIIVTGIYISIPFLMIPGVVLLYYYELSVTSLTFVVLIIIAMLCVLTIVWIMVEETEASSNIPGGWTDIQRLVKNVTTQAEQTAHA